jgi:hypothetical protein
VNDTTAGTWATTTPSGAARRTAAQHQVQRARAEQTRGKGREQTAPGESSPRGETPGQHLDGGGATDERFTAATRLGFGGGIAGARR